MTEVICWQMVDNHHFFEKNGGKIEGIPEYKDSGAQIMECKQLRSRLEKAMEIKRRDQIKYDHMMLQYNKNAKIIKGLWGFGIGFVILAAIVLAVIVVYFFKK